MESKRSYKEIKPDWKWLTDQHIDILEIDLPGFKKEQLRVQLNNAEVLVITGERLVDQTSVVTFREEIKVSNDDMCSEIRAKLTDGVFYIIMPKKSITLSNTRTENNQPFKQNEEHVVEKSEVEEKLSSGGDDDDVSGQIEPDCKWRKGQPIDILEIHDLEDFKKEQLRVQLSNSGMLAITGERPSDKTKWVKFRKEFKVSDGCIRSEIRAKLTDGVFYVIMPEKSSTLSNTRTENNQPVEQNKDEKSEMERLKNVVAVMILGTWEIINLLRRMENTLMKNQNLKRK